MEIALIAGTVSGWVLAAWSYYHLRKWAKEIRGSRIAIAYKRKVKIDAPLVEWLLWIRQAGKEKGSTGRMVYSMGGTSVVIVQRIKTRTVWKMKARRAVNRVRKGSPHVGSAPAGGANGGTGPVRPGETPELRGTA